jgi:hypothetical protein
MSGLPANAILLTTGDNDTYPPWLLQARGIGKNILVLNISLLHLTSYRDAICQELGIAPIPLNETEESRKQFREKIVPLLAANVQKRPVYLALTVSDHYTQPIENDLYLCGLAYQYSTTNMDNMAELQRNFEQQYTLDYLDKSFYPDLSTGIVRRINNNYIVPMLKLYDHYKASGDVARQQWIKNKLLAVAIYSDEEQKVKAHLNQE